MGSNSKPLHCFTQDLKFKKDISGSDVSNGPEVSMILISNSSLTLDFPSRDALAISFLSAFSLVTYSDLRPASSPRQPGYAIKTQTQRHPCSIFPTSFWHEPKENQREEREMEMSLTHISYHNSTHCLIM